MELTIMAVLAILQAGQGGGGGGGFGGGGAADAGAQVMLQLIGLVVGQLISGACWWGAFVKAGQPGWAGFIPIYREIILLQIAEKPVWWVVLMYFCPIVNIIIFILVYIEVANKFGQGAGFAIGMVCCGIIFVPILSYGSSQYLGGAGSRRRDDDDEDDDRPRRSRPRDEDDDDDEGERRVTRRPRDD